MSMELFGRPAVSWPFSSSWKSTESVVSRRRVLTVEKEADLVRLLWWVLVMLSGGIGMRWSYPAPLEGCGGGVHVPDILLSRWPFESPLPTPSCPSEVVGGVAGGLVKVEGCMRLGLSSRSPFLETFATKCLAPPSEPDNSLASPFLGTRMNSLLSFANFIRP